MKFLIYLLILLTIKYFIALNPIRMIKIEMIIIFSLILNNHS
jgi:hypothetical protein